ncbi:MAG: methyltransferase domain-containing protein [Armatimonadetes bacterium]|nr:methyltransferase domain-containing protein [Armatimonadota bacterium]
MPATVDETRLHEFLGKAIVDMGATFHAACVVLGDRLGWYKALAGSAPMTPAELAGKTGTDERYAQEWLNGQAAGGYVSYDNGRYFLTPEQAMCLADETSPTYLPGGFEVGIAATRALERLQEVFRNGQGLGWHEHHQCLFCGTERFFRPNYAANLISNWIPALGNVEDRLRAGAEVADVGCGHGASTVLMAKAFPRSRFVGFDYHEGSIAEARKRAEQAGVSDRVRFEVARAKDYPGSYDFVTFFDCLHDMGDPIGAAAHVKKSLKPDGCWMIVEPFAHDDVQDNLNPIGRVYYSASTLLCTPASRSQEVGLALGAQAGEARLREVVTAGGFTRFRRAAETPFNLVLEARP